MAIAVEASHQRRGLGTWLMQTALEWAKREKIVRLELTVATENAAAIGLYKAQGFVEEGTKRKSFMLDGRLADEYLMACILDGELSEHQGSTL